MDASAHNSVQTAWSQYSKSPKQIAECKTAVSPCTHLMFKTRL